MPKLFRKIGLISASLALLTLTTSTVFAAESTGYHTMPPVSPNNTSAQQMQTAAQVRLHLCDTRLSVITGIMSRIETRLQNQLNYMSGIASRVEAFYAKSGKTVSNYSQLTAAVSGAEAQAQSDLTALEDSGSFSCGVSSPGSFISSFQARVKTVITDLQNLRTTIKDLIVAVAQANGVKVDAGASGQVNSQ